VENRFFKINKMFKLVSFGALTTFAFANNSTFPERIARCGVRDLTAEEFEAAEAARHVSYYQVIFVVSYKREGNP
jgi:hypothetical protein